MSKKAKDDRKWEPWYAPDARTRKGKRPIGQRYPGKAIRYSVEAAWGEDNTGLALRGYCIHEGKRVWTGQERRKLGEALADGRDYARGWEDRDVR